MEGVPTTKFKSHPKVKNLKEMIKDFRPYFASIQYLGSSKSNVKELTEYLLPEFDLIIALRNLDGDRVVCNLIKGRKNVNGVYTNPKFQNYIAA